MTGTVLSHNRRPSEAARVGGGHPAQVEVALSGMTCASCAVRVEKRLNQVAGVKASVNFATATAAVSFDPQQASLDDIVVAVESVGYKAALPETGGDGAQPGADLRSRLAIAVALAVPVTVWAWSPSLRFDGWRWASLALATTVVGYCGWPFHRAAMRNARHGVLTMDTLVSLGTLAAWSWSAAVVSAGMRQGLYFDTAALITALILLGRYLEERARRRSGEALRALAQLGAKQARVFRNGIEEPLPAAALRVGDLFVVRPGEKIATDGLVVAGRSAIDQSTFTGEPVPVEVKPGDGVTGGAVNTSGRIVVRATRVGSATALAQIARLVAQAQGGKAEVQRLADRVSAVFVPVVVGLALATLVGWLLLGSAGPSTAFIASVAVVVIACPCALGLATPTALMVGTGRGAQLGVVIKGPEVLEQTRRVTTIVLDKTGTLTEGKLEVTAVVPAAGITENELVRLAAAVEDASEHPIARAIAGYGRKMFRAFPDAVGFNNFAGLGAMANVDGRHILVGSERLLIENGVNLPVLLRAEAKDLEEKGLTVVAAAADGQAIGLIAVLDRAKPTSSQAVAELEQLGLTPVLLTGDNERTARAIADEVGIERVVASVLPDAKAAEVRRLQEAGEVVAMVGDGVNDAPALAQADLGISLGTGADVAIEASDITLVSGDLRAAADAIRLARATLSTIKGNLFWAFAYNLVALPLAIAGVVNPIVGAAAMAFSSIVVVSNSLRLRRFQPVRAAQNG